MSQLLSPVQLEELQKDLFARGVCASPRRSWTINPGVVPDRERFEAVIQRPMGDAYCLWFTVVSGVSACVFLEVNSFGQFDFSEVDFIYNLSGVVFDASLSEGTLVHGRMCLNEVFLLEDVLFMQGRSLLGRSWAERLTVAMGLFQVYLDQPHRWAVKVFMAYIVDTSGDFRQACAPVDPIVEFCFRSMHADIADIVCVAVPAMNLAAPPFNRQRVPLMLVRRGAGDALRLVAHASFAAAPDGLMQCGEVLVTEKHNRKIISQVFLAEGKTQAAFECVFFADTKQWIPTAFLPDTREPIDYRSLCL